MARFSTELCGREAVRVVLVLVFLLAASLPGVAQAQLKGNKREIISQVAQDWIEVGREQYKRGFYMQAEKSFLAAQDYIDYLTAEEREKLNSLLVKTHRASLERKRNLETIQTAAELVERGQLVQLIEAKVQLEKIKDSGFLTERERERVTELLGKTDVFALERKRILERIQVVNELVKKDRLTMARARLEEVAGSKFLTREELNKLGKLREKADMALSGGKKEQILESLRKVSQLVKRDRLTGTKASLEKVASNEFLTKEEQKRLNELLEKTRTVALERKLILETVVTANGLVKRNELMGARRELGKVRGKEFLTKEERKLIAEGLKKIDEHLKEHKKEVAELSKHIMEFYRACQRGKVREGLVKVESVKKRSVDVRGEVFAVPEAKPVRKAELEMFREPENDALIDAAEPVADEGGQTEGIDRKKNILRSYTRAVINDTVGKVESYIRQGEFDKAKVAGKRAEQAINKNRLYLGDRLSRQYSRELKQLTTKIVQRKK